MGQAVCVRFWAALSSACLLATNAVPSSAQEASPPPSVSATPPVLPSSLPVSAFAQLPFIESPTMSPNGERIAGFFAVGGRQSIGIFNLLSKNEKMVWVNIPDNTQTMFIRWVGDDNVVIGVRALLIVDAGERWYISRLLGVNRVTGKITKLLWDMGGQNAADLLWVPADGSKEVLVAAQNSIYLGEDFWPTVYRVNVETGSKSRVLRGREQVMGWDADARGTIRTGLRHSDEGRKFSLLYRGEGQDGSFRIIDSANTLKQEVTLSPILFLPGSDHAVTLHDDDKGISGLYETNLLTRDDVRTVYLAPEGVEIDGVRVSADGLTLLGATTSAADWRTHWFDADLAALQKDFDTAVGSRRARIVSFSNDRKRMLVRVDSANTPGSIYFYDVADGALRRVGNINDVIGSRSLSPVKTVRYKARDGLEIEAILTLPRGVEAKNLPIVLLPHGGPWGQDTLDYDYWAQFIASRGYAVLQPNFRGSTGYGREFVDKGIGQLGLAMQDDITDGLRWAVEQGLANPARACIVGASYGGYAAMWGIAKDPDQYRCAISIAGVAHLRREVNDMADSVYGKKYKDDWQRMTPDFAAVSPINAIDRMKAPLLLIHGKRDITVDHSQSTSMNGRMRDAGKNVEFVSMPLADHHFTRYDDRLLLLSSIEAFLAKHNPSGSPAITSK